LALLPIGKPNIIFLIKVQSEGKQLGVTNTMSLQSRQRYCNMLTRHCEERSNPESTIIHCISMDCFAGSQWRKCGTSSV